MKLVLLTLCISILSVSVTAQSDVKLKINSKLPSKYVKQSKGLTLTAASQMFPFIEITIKNVEYLIAFDDDDRKIKYIYTEDENFVDGHGRKVDQEITVKYEDIEILGDFQLRTKSDKNGWQAVIGNSFAFSRGFLERVQRAGKLTTEIEGFAKGYNN